MSFKRSVVLAWLLALALASVQAQPGTIEDIRVLGLFRMTNEAFLHALGLRVGDPYDVVEVRTRFRELWKLGLFADLTIEAEVAAEGGTALIIKVKERPVLTSVTYEDNSVATRTQIEDALKERKLQLKLGKPVDPGAIFGAESAIRDLLGQKGFLQASVDSEIRRITETTRGVHFQIRPGGKTRIRRISFQGNELFSNRKLRGALELTQPRKWYWPWSQKNLYHPLKWEQDVTNLRKLYQDQGYLDVEIKPPVVEVVGGKSKRVVQDPAAEGQPTGTPEPVDPVETIARPAAEELAGLSPKQRERALSDWRKQVERERRRQEKASKKSQKKDKSWVELTVAVNEGPQYTLGDVSIDGNEKFPDELLRAGIPLASGGILRNNLLDAGIDGIRRLYENQGHLYATVVRRLERREEGLVADVEISIDEDKPYYVGKIEFAGNTSTQDRVLRRELLLAEGDLFSRDKLDVSRIKVNQLGYFAVPGEPLVEPAETESRVGITMLGEEQGRNEIQVGGGYSGLDGAFFNGTYSTRNFLGRGQVLSAALQIGGRTSRYQLSWQDPWFRNRPILFGASVFRRDLDFGVDLRSRSEGFGLIIGRRLGRFSQFNIGYNLERLESSNPFQIFDVDSLVTLGSAQTSAGTLQIPNDNRISSVTPVFSFSTINNPYRPTRGRELTVSVQVAGGPLGGDTAFLKPVARFTGYRRGPSKTYLALHAQLGLVSEWADGSEPNPSNVNGVPRVQRFWLGGDTGIGPRVFQPRSISPLRFATRDPNGTLTNFGTDPRGFALADCFDLRCGFAQFGGDRFFLLQTEWAVPLNEQAELAVFVDAGDSLFEDQSLDLSTARVSAGVELRFYLPIFPVPLRLIYGVPVRQLSRDRTNNFTFSIGRSF